MQSIGLPEILIALVAVAIFAIPLWFGWKARPLGSKGYGYATYFAIVSVIVALPLPQGIDSGVGVRHAGAAVTIAVVVATLAASIGILLRHKAGVVAMVAAFALDLYRWNWRLPVDVLSLLGDGADADVLPAAMASAEAYASGVTSR